MHGTFEAPPPRNEAVFDYRPNSTERAQLDTAIDDLLGQSVDIPLVIGGEKIRTGKLGDCRVPHEHQRKLGVYHAAGEEHIDAAVSAALSARVEWASMRWQDRAAILLRAADILTGRKRMLINAAAMLGLSKTPHQSEIDAVCELADFLRFNVHFMAELYRE